MRAMKEILQLRIPAPCGEDWERMDRGERGKFCLQCQKMVVDFTGMTDEEILGYFASMSRSDESRVCGRLLSGQLGRDLVPAPMQRNGWSAWRWVLASALMLARPAEGSRPVKTAAVERRVKNGAPTSRLDAGVGFVIRVAKNPKARKKTARFVRDPVKAWRPSVAHQDSVKGPSVSGAIPVANGVVPDAGVGLVGFAGGVSIGRSVRVDTSILQKVVDTISARAPWQKEDLVTLYPNPVERGEALHLAWLSKEGKYELTLFNMRGQVITGRLIEVGGAGQVDALILPVGIAAGVYAVRVVATGGGRVMVREVVVR